MPRGGGGGGGGGRSGGGGGFRSGGWSRPAPRAQKPPATASPAPVPATQNGGSGSMLGSLRATVADGLAWGASNAVAHRVVDAVVGPRTINVQHGEVSAPAPSSHAVGSDACGSHNQAFLDCLNSCSNDINRCQFYMDKLSECRQNSGSLSV